MSVIQVKAKYVCFIDMQQQKVKFKIVQINMKQVSYYHISSLIWHTVSRLADEAIPLDHPGCFVSQVIRWYDLIHSMIQ